MEMNEGPRSGRRQRADGARTRAAILDTATRLASVEGIRGITLGRLAAELGVSKSGLYAHFGSKEQLQLETIDAAQGIFDQEVVIPAFAVPEGLARLEAFLDAYFSYLERHVFPGGCFFAALLAEMDAAEGPVHEKVVEIERSFAREFASLVEAAQATGEIPAEVDAPQLVFELYACMEMTNYHFILFRDPEILTRGRRAVRNILTRHVSDARSSSGS